MVEFLEGRTLSKYLLEKYAKNPRGWTFTVFPGKRTDNGFGALIGPQDEMWRLQLDSVYSANPLMLGAKADVDADSLPKSGTSYGYRKLTRKAIMAILRQMEKEQEGAAYDTRDYVEPGALNAKRSESLDRILGSLQPVSPKGTGAYAEGPIVLTSRMGVAPVIDKQKDLEEKLSAELRRLVKNKYSAYG